MISVTCREALMRLSAKVFYKKQTRGYSILLLHESSLPRCKFATVRGEVDATRGRALLQARTTLVGSTPVPSIR